MLVQHMNSSLTEQHGPDRRQGRGKAHPRRSASDRFESAYGRCWASLHREADPDLSRLELEVLHHAGADADGVGLTWLAKHLGRPKSTTSVAVKDLERRGFLRRARHADDERRVAIVLTPAGRTRVASDRVLEPAPLAAALRALPRGTRDALLNGIERLAIAAEQLPSVQ
jgi:DNA-binding MarR family transcriptional regulator